MWYIEDESWYTSDSEYVCACVYVYVPIEYATDSRYGYVIWGMMLVKVQLYQES
jgi:hypothetical protein